LILIAHSFGELVVLKVCSDSIWRPAHGHWHWCKALCEAYHEKAEWLGLFGSVVGLIFFGTPFRGADGMIGNANWVNSGFCTNTWCSIAANADVALTANGVSILLFSSTLTQSLEKK
jgi:hypothetical protein